MIAFVCLILAASSVLAIRALVSQRDAARIDLAAAQDALAIAINERAEARAECDAALIERNAAIESVQWVPLSSVELGRLAKTGCHTCFGAGYSENASGRAVCVCVAKKMSADRKYGFSGATPVRLALPSDSLPEQKLRSVERN